MPILPICPDIDPEIIDILIKKEREEQDITQERPFLQIPVPNLVEIPQIYEKKEKKQNNNEIIIIDL
jgi:hypothetical protein